MTSGTRPGESLEDALLALSADELDCAMAELVAAGLPVEQIGSRPWWLTARTEQLPTGEDWSVWLYMAGRGAGKTAAGAHWVVGEALAHPNSRGALVGPTAGDVRDVMIEGTSGVLAVARRLGAPATYEPSKRRVTFPTGSTLTAFSAEEPDRLRGPEHGYAWADELAAWHWQRRDDAWANLVLGLRIGDRPQIVATTTPRPVPLLRTLIADESVRVVRGSTRDNRRNLAPGVVAELEARYGGTRLGRQELEGELLDDIDGALWQRRWIDDARTEQAPPLERVVVAVDPAVTVSETSDETGVIVAGADRAGDLYVLDDRSARCAGRDAARRAWRAFLDHRADLLVYEANQGGAWVGQVLADEWAALQRDGEVPAGVTAPLRTTTASVGKSLRAQPVALRYEQGRVHHVRELDELEQQLCDWVPDSGASPDRLDALVWALAHLIGAERQVMTVSSPAAALRARAGQAGTSTRIDRSLTTRPSRTSAASAAVADLLRSARG